MKILTEADLRTRNGSPPLTFIEVTEDTFVTPLAREYMCDHQIELRRRTGLAKIDSAPSKEPGAGRRQYATMEASSKKEKPENMTHLDAKVLAHKSHPRIEFRGQLDHLQAETIYLQVIASEQNKSSLVDSLQEIIDFLRQILSADVKGEELEPMSLFGMSLDQLRALSHAVYKGGTEKSLTPHYGQGEIAVGLNRLRTIARICELACIRAFPDNERADLQYLLNRLSSSIFILYYWELAGRA